MTGIVDGNGALSSKKNSKLLQNYWCKLFFTVTVWMVRVNDSVYALEVFVYPVLTISKNWIREMFYYLKHDEGISLKQDCYPSFV